jgi:hypothetical protein
MTMPIEVKLALERKAIEMAVTIVGVHSVRLVDDDTVSAIFDIAPDESGNGLYFEFPLPQLVSRNDLYEFGCWLAATGYGGETVH